jgi:ABC-2 type transport system ATP-binding protein
MSNTVIELKKINKSFGRIRALINVSLEVYGGQICGIIGPNGSGKTTLLRILLSLAKPDSGTVKLFGSNDLTTGIKRTGSHLEGTNFYGNFSIEKNLKIVAYVKNTSLKQTEHVLHTVGLFEKRQLLYKQLSFGMKQRLFIASALLGDPDLLILDEPTNGLDPTGIIELRSIMLQLNQEGKTILIAGHMLSEMEKMCTDIVIIDKGSIIERDSLRGIMKGFPSLEDAYIQSIRHL